MFKRLLDRKKIYAVFLLIGWFLPPLAHAQMFSAGSNYATQSQQRPFFNIVAGIKPIDFNYRGKSITNGSPATSGNTGFYQFNGSVIHVGLRLPVVTLYSDIGGKFTGIHHDISYFSAGIRLGYGLPLYHSRIVYVHLPLQLHSAYTTVNRQNIVVSNIPDFQLGTFEGTVGIAAMVQAAHNFRIGADVLPSYGFAFSTRQRNENGGVGEVKGQLNLYFDHLFNKAGLSVGYAYTFRQFNIDGEFLDYRSLANSFLIGITF